MEKKMYVAPEAEVLEFENDVIATSGDCWWQGGGKNTMSHAFEGCDWRGHSSELPAGWVDNH